MNEEKFSYAGFWKRFAASIVDSFIEILIGLVVGFIFGLWYGFSFGTATGAEFFGYIIGILAGWIYFAAMESSSRQATFGKLALGIIVTDLDGDRISFPRATGRYFAKFLSFLILGIGFLMAGFTKKKQALHDIIAECLVINKESKK